MPEAILFDLGNTLVEYYEAHAFTPILARSIAGAGAYLGVAANDERVSAENFEAPDFRVRPLEERLARIFALSPADARLTLATEAFMRPILDLGRVYDDTRPILHQLRRRGFRLGIVSNTAWGSPPHLWRSELERLGLAKLVDTSVFCGDVGWRKPAETIFHHALQQLGASAEQTLFVGDDPHWDIEGPQRVGMRALLLDRKGHMGEQALAMLARAELKW